MSLPHQPFMPMQQPAGGHEPASYTLPTAFPIRSIHDENYRTKTFVLDGRLDAYPGQFVMAWLPRFDEKPFSLVDADPITLMVTAVGPFSRLLHEKKVGDLLWVRGAFGRGFQIAQTTKRPALVGGGYGVAPLHWLARTQIGVAERITVIVGARTGVDLLYTGRFAALIERARRSGSEVEWIPTTEDSSQGIPGRVVDALNPLLAEAAVDGIFGCGPHGMLAALAQLGEQYAVPTQLSWEAYMRCAVGICGACEHAGQLLCLDGPVLATSAA